VPENGSFHFFLYILTMALYGHPQLITKYSQFAKNLSTEFLSLPQDGPQYALFGWKLFCFVEVSLYMVMSYVADSVEVSLYIVMSYVADSVDVSLYIVISYVADNVSGVCTCKRREECTKEVC
jgi:hypothetical protein